MAKRSSAVPDSFEVDVVSLLRGQVDAIVHELVVAISDIQSGFPEEGGRRLPLRQVGERRSRHAGAEREAA